MWMHLACSFLIGIYWSFLYAYCVENPLSVTCRKLLPSADMLTGWISVLLLLVILNLDAYGGKRNVSKDILAMTECLHDTPLYIPSSALGALTEQVLYCVKGAVFLWFDLLVYFVEVVTPFIRGSSIIVELFCVLITEALSTTVILAVKLRETLVDMGFI